MSGLTCRGVTAGYGDKQVLHGVDLEVGAGEWVAVIGPNGCGKSTLLRAIAGIIPAGGEVAISGATAGEVSRRRLARLIAMVPQNPVIPEAMAVIDYVLLGRTPYIPPWGMESALDLQVAERVMGDLDLDGMGGRTLGSLSGGELQRAILARALAQEAPLLLLDEPTTALDVGHQQQVLELVDSLRTAGGMAVVAAMHDLTLAAQYADRMVLLRNGRAEAAGRAEEVLTAERVADHYGAEVIILHGPGGELVVAPRRPGSRPSSPQGSA